MTSFPAQSSEGYTVVPFAVRREETELIRAFDPHPFVPSSKRDRDKRCDEILTIQAMGLKKRLEHTHCRSAVVGISGGLDSTLALLVTARAFDMLGIPRPDIQQRLRAHEDARRDAEGGQYQEGGHAAF